MLRKQRRVRWCSLIGFIMRIQSAKEEIMFSISNKCSPSVTYQSNVDPPTLCTLSIEATLGELMSYQSDPDNIAANSFNLPTKIYSQVCDIV